MAIDLSETYGLIGLISPKIKAHFGVEISIDGLEETLRDIDTVLETDFDSLRELYKQCIAWADYLGETNAIISIYLDQFRNTQDVYKYLEFLTKKDVDRFMVLAPRYKIATRDKSLALSELKVKIDDMKYFLDRYTYLCSKLESYIKLLNYHSYRIKRLINASYQKYARMGDIT